MTLTRPPSRSLPVLELVPSGVAPTGPRDPLAPDDERLAEFRPEPRALPAFFVWTLGCQMNKSDSEEMAGRLLTAGCAEAPSMETADLVVINTCAIRETAEAKVIGRQGHLRRLKAANPGLRVVMTGCSVRESNRDGLARRYPAIDLFLRPDEEPELVDRLGLASAQAPVGALAAAPTTAATTVVKGARVSDATHLVRARADAITGGAVSRDSAISAWLPIIYGCDKTCTYCIVPYSRGPERSRPFDEIVAEAKALAAAGYREVTLLGQNVNSYGHDLPPEPRFAHVRTTRMVGRRQDREGRPDLAELIRAVDAIRTTDGTPAIPRLRFVTSHPWDLSDRLIEAMVDCPSVCESLHLPVQSGSDSMLRRMGRQYTVEHYLERLARIRDAVPGIALSTDVIVGFCGETEAEYAATLRLLETIRFDQVFAAAYSERPGTPAEHLADDVQAADKRRRLVELLDVQERIGHERNLAWQGRTVEVLLDAVVPPRRHMHDDEPAGTDESRDAFAHLPDGIAHLSGRSRENKLVHVAGSPAMLGSRVDVRIEHAGPYALRGVQHPRTDGSPGTSPPAWEGESSVGR
jgi:tRNA-2-methylthio-N6-dimethylallyladenosine synthase